MLGGVEGGVGGGGFLSEVFRGKGTVWERLVRASGEVSRRREARRAAQEERPPRKDPQVARSRLAVGLEARLAVRSGVRLDDFLRGRLARYAAELPVPLEALPAVVDVEDGEPVVRARPGRGQRAAAPATAAAWMDALVAREGPYAAQALRDAEASVAALEARARAARERAEALARTLADDLAAGTVPSPPRIEATPEQLGRPAVPSAAPAAILQGFVLALLAAEGWRFSGPALAATGFEPGVNVLAALETAPLPAAMGLVFALGAAVAVFAFASFALTRARAAVAQAEAPRRRAVFAAGAIGSAAISAAVAAAAASDASSSHVVLLAAVPFGAALVLDLAARLAKARGCALDAALAWDRERAREFAERARRVEVVERAEAELARATEDLEAARRRLAGLERRAVDATRAAERRAAAEARRLERLVESLAGALELDRYAFVRLAADRAHEVLVRPVRSAPRREPAVAERLGVAG
jgi:hypothetical protein